MLTYGVLAGIGGALLMTPAFACIGHFFHRRQGLATGIANTSGSVGGVVIPLLLENITGKVGFAWSTRILAFVLVAMAVPANLFLKTRLPLATRSTSVWPDMTILRNPSFAACSVGMFFMEWGLFVVLAYIASYVAQNEQIRISSYSVVAILNAGSFFGRWIPGFLADRYGRFNVILITILLCSTTILALWLPASSSTALVVMFAITFGFASGSNLGLIPVCLSQLCSSQAYGRYLSAAYFFTSFGSVTLSNIALLRLIN
nr:riboflavin transporter mch5 [Quercus suber]